jgi:hypothetical protein
VEKFTAKKAGRKEKKVIENENCPRKKTYTTQTSRIKKEKLWCI